MRTCSVNYKLRTMTSTPGPCFGCKVSVIRKPPAAARKSCKLFSTRSHQTKHSAAAHQHDRVEHYTWLFESAAFLSILGLHH